MVFTDFTTASSVAADHCYQLASLFKAEVRSFHVINSEADREWAEEKSAEQMRKLANYDTAFPSPRSPHRRTCSRG